MIGMPTKRNGCSDSIPPTGRRRRHDTNRIQCVVRLSFVSSRNKVNLGGWVSRPRRSSGRKAAPLGSLGRGAGEFFCGAGEEMARRLRRSWGRDGGKESRVWWGRREVAAISGVDLIGGRGGEQFSWNLSLMIPLPSVGPPPSGSGIWNQASGSRTQRFWYRSGDVS
jgi:hypothetical protein